MSLTNAQIDEHMTEINIACADLQGLLCTLRPVSAAESTQARDKLCKQLARLRLYLLRLNEKDLMSDRRAVSALAAS
jgi:hypothetical protein